jgi:hypothetical protein
MLFPCTKQPCLPRNFLFLDYPEYRGNKLVQIACNYWAMTMSTVPYLTLSNRDAKCCYLCSKLYSVTNQRTEVFKMKERFPPYLDNSNKIKWATQKDPTKGTGINLHISLLHIIFFYMFQFIWAVIKEKEVQEKICMKTLTCILTRIHTACWYKIQQQVLCMQYKWWLKLEGLK